MGNTRLNIQSLLNIDEFIALLQDKTGLSDLSDRQHIYELLSSEIAPLVRYVSVLSTVDRIRPTVEYFIDKLHNDNEISFEDRRNLKFVILTQQQDTLTAADFNRLLGIFSTITMPNTAPEPMSIYDHILRFEDKITSNIAIKALTQYMLSHSQVITMHAYLRKSTKTTWREFLDNLESDGLVDKNIDMLQQTFSMKSNITKSAEKHFMRLKHLGMDMENVKMLITLYYKRLPDVSNVENQKIKSDPRFTLHDNITFKQNQTSAHLDWRNRLGLVAGRTEDVDEEITQEGFNLSPPLEDSTFAGARQQQQISPIHAPPPQPQPRTFTSQLTVPTQQHITHTSVLEMAKNIASTSIEKSIELLL